MSEITEQLTSLLEQGYSLSSFMIPDPVMPSNAPEHLESYHFPFVFIKDNALWACTRSTHRVIRARLKELFGEGQHDLPHNSSFFYSSGLGGVFSNYTSHLQVGVFMLKHRYKTFNWVLHQRSSLVWDSNNKRDFEALRQSQIEGQELFASYTDVDDSIFYFPIDLLNIELENDTFSLRSESIELPTYILTVDKKAPSQILDLLGSEEKMHNSVPYNSEKIFFWNCFFEDNNYYSYIDEVRKEQQQYKSLKIFARNNQNIMAPSVTIDAKQDFLK